ncbi:MAG TPA: hypothetical protein PKD17_18700, partial [Cellvibrionaceae bacterium]|nr:hypothetical protein [Cellvibrionaceae bacterium]
MLLVVPAHASSIRGPISFGPDARVKIECPGQPAFNNAVQSEVVGFGNFAQRVNIKLLYRPDLSADFNLVPGTDKYTKDYFVALNSYLGNFPGPGYYAINMRNNNSFVVNLPANEEFGINCR